MILTRTPTRCFYILSNFRSSYRRVQWHFSSCQSMWVFSVLSKSFFFVLLYFSVYDTLNTHDERCLRNKFSRNMESCKWNIYLWKKKEFQEEGGSCFITAFSPSLACGLLNFHEKRDEILWNPSWDRDLLGNKSVKLHSSWDRDAVMKYMSKKIIPIYLNYISRHHYFKLFLNQDCNTFEKRINISIIITIILIFSLNLFHSVIRLSRMIIRQEYPLISRSNSISFGGNDIDSQWRYRDFIYFLSLFKKKRIFQSDGDNEIERTYRLNQRLLEESFAKIENENYIFSILKIIWSPLNLAEHNNQ